MCLNKKAKVFMMVVFLNLTGCSLFAPTNKEQNKINVLWYSPHGPIDIVEKGVNAFRNELEKTDPGKFDIKFQLAPRENQYDYDFFTKQIDLLIEGKIQILQIYTSALSNLEPEFYVLDVPYLFTSDKHAFKFMDSDTGKDILKKLERHNIKGLAYTYSGGFRVISTLGKEFSNLNDIKGAKIFFNGRKNNAVMKDTYTPMGAEGIAMPRSKIVEALTKNKIDGFESIYPRIDAFKNEERPKVINELKHRLQLTAVLVNMDFFNSMSPELQKSFSSAIEKSSKVERQAAIDAGLRIKKQFIKEGIKVVTVKNKDLKKIRKIFDGFAEKYKDLFSIENYKKIKKMEPK